MYFVGIVFVMLITAGVGFGQDSIRSVRAIRTGSPKIDGTIDAEWLKAEPADDFIQRRPVEGAPESRPTRVFVLYDDDAVSFCFVCNDDPDSISARVLRRDNTANCDLIAVYLDSFHDHRNCYYFAVTASGGQVDGVMTNETSQDDSWDGVWESAGGRTDSGWVAELRIPFSSFRHGGAREDGWGLNLVRLINRNNEATFWQPVNNQRGLRVGEFGALVGLENIGSSAHLELRPHVVGRWDAPQNQDWRDRTKAEDVGFYLKYVPRSSWAADFAYQPDFAQVDVDAEVINTSDYPVFLTEKRPFFLEVGNFFDTSPIQLLYTRRITDPDFVTRLYSQSEKFRGMVLGGQNRTVDGNGQAVGAGRAQWNVGERSSVGLTSTALYQDNGQPNVLVSQAGIYQAYSGGLDARFRWGQENQWAVSAAGVARTSQYHVSDLFEDRRYKYDSQPLEVRSTFFTKLGATPFKLQLSDAYRGQDYNINDLGWGEFSNVIEHHAWMGNIWQVQPTFIQSWGLDVEGWQRTLPDGRFPEGGIFFNVYFTTKSNLDVGAGTDWGVDNRRKYTGSISAGEFRDSYFEWYGRFDFENHPYHTQWGWFETDDRRWLTYYTEGNVGTFREGHKQIWNHKLTVKPRANLETSLAVDWTRLWDVGYLNDYALTEGRIFRWGVLYSPILHLSLRGTLQWIDKGDPQITGNESNTLLTNLLLAWNWRPGSWLYLVYDEGRTTEPLAYKTEGDRTVRVKGTYFFTVK